MTELWRGRHAVKYLFFEMLPTFVLGVIVFLLIILMFQSFRLTEYIIVHGASLQEVGLILFYMAVSFLPILFPMSLLFAILLTYGRLSRDSEIVAMKALGLSRLHLIFPALLLAVLTSLMSAQTSFNLAPWGNRQMEVLIHKLGQTKPGAAIREGVFSEGFFNLVIYANNINSEEGLLKKVFIYDERNESSPLTIIAKEGQLIREKDEKGQRAFLRLFDGNIHRTKQDSYTKINFDLYDINLYDPVKYSTKIKTNLSYTMKDIEKALKDETLPLDLQTKLFIEKHRRWAISLVSIVFALLGVGLGTTTNKREAKSSGFVLCLGLVVVYWVAYASFENLAKSGALPVWIAIWTPDVLFAIGGLWSLRKV